jgi:hypothetical protein
MSSKVQVTCEYDRCAKLFTARTADRKRGWARFCSKSCKAFVQEKKTGQNAAYQARKSAAEQSDYDIGMEAVEAGWDGHKNVF